MFSTIVVGTDGSPDATRALRAAAEMAQGRPDVAVHVVSANHPLTALQLREMGENLPAEFRVTLHSHVAADAKLSAARQIMEASGVHAHYHDLDADPTEALLDTIAATEADLVIVGSRGEGAAKRLLHGSVSTKVLHHAPCAVLVVKETEA